MLRMVSARSFERLRQQRGDDFEAAPRILRRLTAIERALGVTEPPECRARTAAGRWTLKLGTPALAINI
jgi:hypothetical protein